MSSFFMILFLAGVAVKVSQALKNFTQSFLYSILSMLGLVLLFKWILKPLFKFLIWSGKKLWPALKWTGKQINLGLEWLGNKMIDHFSYRSDYLYWLNVANSKDRMSFISEKP